MVSQVLQAGNQEAPLKMTQSGSRPASHMHACPHKVPLLVRERQRRSTLFKKTTPVARRTTVLTRQLGTTLVNTTAAGDNDRECGSDTITPTFPSGTAAQSRGPSVRQASDSTRHAEALPVRPTDKQPAVWNRAGAPVACGSLTPERTGLINNPTYAAAKLLRHILSTPKLWALDRTIIRMRRSNPTFRPLHWSCVQKA